MTDRVIVLIPCQFYTDKETIFPVGSLRFFGGSNQQRKGVSLTVFFLFYWLVTIRQFEIIFPNDSSSYIFQLPCRASPYGVPSRKLDLHLPGGFWIFLTVITPSRNFIFPVVYISLSLHRERKNGSDNPCIGWSSTIMTPSPPCILIWVIGIIN